MPLIAFNIDLDSPDVAVARQIAATVRESSGGLPFVKAMGVWLAHRGVAQVSMNLTDFTRTSLQTVFDAVARAARTRGAEVLQSELIGLIPEAALEATTPEQLRLAGFTRSQILEERRLPLADRAPKSRGFRLARVEPPSRVRRRQSNDGGPRDNRGYHHARPFVVRGRLRRIPTAVPAGCRTPRIFR